MGSSLCFHGRKLVSKLFRSRRQAFEARLVISLLVGGGTFVDIDGSPSEHAINPLGQLACGGKDGDVRAEPLSHTPIVRAERRLAAAHQVVAAMRSAAPTRALVLAGFLRFFTG